MTARAPSECPVCGEPVPGNARACPHCGADERSGWNEEATRYDGLNLPGGADEAEDRPRKRPLLQKFSPIVWAVVATVMALLILRLSLR